MPLRADSVCISPVAVLNLVSTSTVAGESSCHKGPEASKHPWHPVEIVNTTRVLDVQVLLQQRLFGGEYIHKMITTYFKIHHYLQ